MRKAKGQTAAIVVLILLASLLFNLWLMLSMDYRANFERHHAKLNAEHVTFVAEQNGDGLNEFLTRLLDGDSRVDEYRLDNCMYMVGTFPYNERGV